VEGLSEEQLITLIKEYYPNTDTKELATKLGISIYTLRRKASKQVDTTTIGGLSYGYLYIH
jgi:predicted transcriptional regulator